MNKTVQKVMFSSKTPSWETPQDFFNECNQKYGPFDLDAAASHTNFKVKHYLTENSLETDWHEIARKVWLNPPYGRNVTDKWVKKAYKESQKGCTVVCLLPARTDTKWFHDYCARGRVIFIKGRLKFGGSKDSAPFPSMLVIFQGAK